MNAIYTALVAEFMAKEGTDLVKGGNLPVIGSLSGSSPFFKPNATPERIQESEKTL